jgi:predicted NACHT family NTPase
MEINIQKLIEEEFNICGFPHVEENIRKKLEKGELLILLDALDEVPKANVDNVVEKIQNFVDKNYKNRFILSCRTAFRKNFRRFTDIEIMEFDDQQIQSFIEHLLLYSCCCIFLYYKAILYFIVTFFCYN